MREIFLGFFFCEFDILKGPVISYEKIKVSTSDPHKRPFLTTVE